MALKITPADSAFSKLVRERSGWKCESCGTQHQEGSQGLHCSHWISRGNWQLRHHPWNGSAACYACHMREGGNWAFRLLTDWQREHLMELSQDLSLGKAARKTKGKGEIAAHYRAELDVMRQARECGHTGRIDFEWFW